MNQFQYEAVVARIREVAVKEQVFPVRGRLNATALRVLTEPMPESDAERRGRIETVAHDCGVTSQMLSMASALGMTDAIGEMVAHNATTLMFALELALRVAEASSLEVSVVDGSRFDG
jgi:hypothetical protein